MGWRPARGNGEGYIQGFNKSGTRGSFDACLTAAGLQELGTGQPLGVHVTLAVAVFAEDPPISVTATLQPFAIPGVGECQFGHSWPSDKYFLGCKSPVWVPREGQVAIGSMESSHSEISPFRYPWAPMNLLPGLSPVFKWVTLPMDSQIRDALANGGQVEFRPETRIAVLRREVTVKEVRFPELR